MKIPKEIKVGALTYQVLEIDQVFCIDNKEVYGKIEYDFAKISIRSDIQSRQRMELTLLHEVIHAITRDRGIDWGDDNENYTEGLARGIHALIIDNPSMFKEVNNNGKSTNNDRG